MDNPINPGSKVLKGEIEMIPALVPEVSSWRTVKCTAAGLRTQIAIVLLYKDPPLIPPF